MELNALICAPGNDAMRHWPQKVGEGEHINIVTVRVFICGSNGFKKLEEDVAKLPRLPLQGGLREAVIVGWLRNQARHNTIA